jgi:hypothetical protein
MATKQVAIEKLSSEGNKQAADDLGGWRNKDEQKPKGPRGEYARWKELHRGWQVVACGLLVLLTLVLTTFGAHSQASPPSAIKLGKGSKSSCMVFSSQERGKRCNSADSMNVTLRNNCTSPVDLRMCVERSQLKPSESQFRWSECALASNVTPDQLTTWGTCHATGNVWVSARPAGSGELFGDPN